MLLVLGLTIVFLWISINVSSKLRYYLKISTIVISCTVIPILLIPLMLIKPRDYRNGWIGSAILSFIGYMLGVNYEIEGLENMDKNKGGVIVFNHQNGLDAIMFSRLYKKFGRFAIVVKQELAYQSPPFGLAAWLCGFLFINRHDRISAQNLINKQKEEILKNKAKLLIFPEGTRNDSSSELLPFKKGAFNVAIASQTFIQPIIVSKYHYFDSRRKLFGRGKSIVKILPEISTKGMTKDDVDVLIEKTRNLMQANYSSLSNKVYEEMENEFKINMVKMFSKK